jgi:hypothetical protein
MDVINQNKIELTYAEYQTRQLNHVSEEGLQQDVAKAKKSTKFIYQNNQWHKIPYSGYAVVSLLKNNPDNEKLIQKLWCIQDKIIGGNNLQNVIYALPKDSFHQTVANTLSDERFLKNIRLAGLENDYPNFVKDAFADIEHPDIKSPIQMKIVGVSVFGSSLGVLGVFDCPNDYERILIFREDFYNNAQLASLDVKCTRPFIGHITLGYFGDDLNEINKTKLHQSLLKINQEIAQQNLIFTISNTELCKYDELSVFDSLPGFPKFQFI